MPSTQLLVRGARRWWNNPTELASCNEKPQRLGDSYDGHPMHIEAKMADDDADRDERRNGDPINRESAAQPAVAQRGDGPQYDRERRADRIKLGHCLVDLEDRLYRDVPLMRIRPVVAQHGLDDVGHDEAAD